MLLDQLKSDYNQALLAHNTLEVSVLRMLISDIKNKEIELRGNGKTIQESDMVSVLQKAVKTRLESAQMFKSAGRDDLYQAETSEMAVIQKYLPAQMSDEQIRSVVQQIVANNDAKDFAAIMKLAMTELKGKADGKTVGEIVRQSLN